MVINVLGLQRFHDRVDSTFTVACDPMQALLFRLHEKPAPLFASPRLFELLRPDRPADGWRITAHPASLIQTEG